MKEKGPRIAFLVLLGLLMAGFIAIIRPFFLPVLFSALVVIICQPIYQFFHEILYKKNYLSAIVSTLMVIICIIAPLGIVVAVIISKASAVAPYITAQVESGEAAGAIDKISLWLTLKSQEYADYLPPDFNLRTTLIDLLKSVSGVVYQYSPKVVAATANAVIGILLFILFIFMLFAEGGRIYQTIMSLLPLKDEYKEILAREVRGVVTGTFLGMLATSAAQGALIGIGFWMVGIDNPFVWGLIAVGVTLVPVIGGPLMYIPPVIVFLAKGEIGNGIVLLTYGVFIVSMIDNVVKPLVMRGKINIHPVLLALSLIGGGLWLGPAGVIIGPLVVALMLACLKIYQREFA